MKLVQKNKVVYDGSSSAIIIDGIDSDNVYMVTAVNCKINADTDYPQLRVTKDVNGTTTAQSAGTAVGGNYGQVTYYLNEAHNGIEFRGLYNGWDEATVVLYEMVP